MNTHAVSLLYHDVVDGDIFDTSGFPGPSAGSYKLTAADFTGHLQAIEAATCGPIVTVSELLGSEPVAVPTILTFDDGGASAWSCVAPLLEERGWRGCFFITTDFIDKPGFLTTGQIRDLHGRGHDIGTHSCSHPSRISDCTREQLLDEWGNSVKVLEGILGTPVAIASIPGGFYSREVAQTAFECGIRTLFTSEPRSRIAYTADRMVIGRYMVKRGDPPSTVDDLIQGKRGQRMRQFVHWNTKKLAKNFLGPIYGYARRMYLAKR